MSDVDFQDYYIEYLHNHYPNVFPGDSPEDNTYTRNRDFFTLKAYENAFGNKDDSWNPTFGFIPNEIFNLKLNEYYKMLFTLNNNNFLWAGLGRMAGGAVLGGLRTASSFNDREFSVKAMVLIGKAIFLDLAWQHEAFIVNPELAINMAHENDRRFPAKNSYEMAWTKIASGDITNISDGNKMLLENEQFSIIQPIYDKIMEKGFFLTGHIANAMSLNIHPYHKLFLMVIPIGNVMSFSDRWNWITEQEGMWEKWINMPSEERDRLVKTLSMDDLISHNWGPTIPELLPPGGPF